MTPVENLRDECLKTMHLADMAASLAELACALVCTLGLAAKLAAERLPHGKGDVADDMMHRDCVRVGRMALYHAHGGPHPDTFEPTNTPKPAD